jgi:hypothetical protein
LRKQSTLIILATTVFAEQSGKSAAKPDAPGSPKHKLEVIETLIGQAKPGEQIPVVSPRLKLPPGHLIWFLGPKTKDGVFLIDTPQRGYNKEELTRIKVRIFKPDSGTSPYLTERDERFAKKAKESARRYVLSYSPPSGVRGGLDIEQVLRPEIRAGRSLSTRVVLTNRSDETLSVRDNLNINYTLRLQRLDADGEPDGPPALLQQKLVQLPGALGTEELGVERIIHGDEFRDLKPGAVLKRPLYFPVAEFPAIKQPGTYLATVIYRSKPIIGKWSGTLVSRPHPFRIRKP